VKTATQDSSNGDAPVEWWLTPARQSAEMSLQQGLGSSDTVAASSAPGHVRGTDSYSTSSPIGEEERQRMDRQAWLHVEAQLRWALHFWVNRCRG
jgi:hypothetical protein